MSVALEALVAVAPEFIRSEDLTTAARSKRDALASRTDVLDKVGALRCLPDDMHVLTMLSPSSTE